MIFECVGVPGVLDQIVRGAPAYARVVVVGVCIQPDMLQPMVALGKELRVQFAFYYSAEEYTVHAHPTLPEAVREAALGVVKRSLNI